MAAIYRARGGVNARKRYMSNKAMARHFFMLDVRHAMERADLRVSNWEKHEEEGGESLYYQIAHALADVFACISPKTWDRWPGGQRRSNAGKCRRL